MLRSDSLGREERDSLVFVLAFMWEKMQAGG
jgi:hypothetical protein